MIKTLVDQRAALLTEAQTIVGDAKAAGRDLTDDEIATVNTKAAAIRKIDDDAKAANSSKAAADLILGLQPFKDGGNGSDKGDAAGDAKNIGAHFAKHAYARMLEQKGVRGASVAAPEFGAKAATDPQLTTGSVYGVVLTQVDRTIVQAVRPRLVVADLLGSGTLAGNAITYFVEAAIEGAFTTVAEGAAKPQLHVVDPTAVTDALKKIAGFIKLSDEMIEDLDFIVSEINNRLLYELAKFEEAQLLNGSGTGTNVRGILQRSGIQSVARGTVASGDTAADTIFRSITAVSTGSGLDADAIVINPLDYQTLRLSKDANGQYYGGGFFAGQYGSGTMQDQPPVWGLRTVVTPAIAQGTALVGSFTQAATLYRKGGVRVESTNSHASDFTSNLITIRAEERVALAVRRPTGFVAVTLTAAP